MLHSVQHDTVGAKRRGAATAAMADNRAVRSYEYGRSDLWSQFDWPSSAVAAWGGGTWRGSPSWRGAASTRSTSSAVCDLNQRNAKDLAAEARDLLGNRPAVFTDLATMAARRKAWKQPTARPIPGRTIALPPICSSWVCTPSAKNRWPSPSAAATGSSPRRSGKAKSSPWRRTTGAIRSTVWRAPSSPTEPLASLSSSWRRPCAGAMT